MLLCSWQQSRISLRELSISSLVIVVKVSWIQRVRARKWIVNLNISLLTLLNKGAALPARLQTTLLALLVVFERLLHSPFSYIKLFTVQIIIKLARCLTMATRLAIVRVRLIALLITLNQLVHLLLGIVQKEISCYIINTELHFLLQLNDCKFFFGVLRVVVWFHRKPGVIKHLLGWGTFVMMPDKHRLQKVG